MKKAAFSLAAAATLLLIGCGGGGGGGGTPANVTLQGHLLDAAVEGVFYSCGGPNYRGFTDKEGTFTCEANATGIQFYLGKLSLGSVTLPTPDGNVYPQDLVGVDRSNFTDPKVIAMAQFFQSLDNDGNPDNGIRISEQIRDRFTTGMRFETAGLDELISTAGVTEVSAATAVDHLRQTMLGTSSSSVSSSASSSSGGGGNATMKAENLPGNTVFIKQKIDTTDDDEWIYIFTSSSKVTVVVKKDGGGQDVYRDADYVIKNWMGIGPVIEIKKKIDESHGISFTVYLNDDHTVKKDQGFGSAELLKIVPNDQNGIDFNEGTIVPGAPVFTEASQLKGYTIESSISNEGVTSQQLTIAFNCDGSFEYKIITKFAGGESIDDYVDNNIVVETDLSHKIHWSYEDGSDLIYMTTDNQLIEGKCWYATKADGSCTGDFRIKKITHKECN